MTSITAESQVHPVFLQALEPFLQPVPQAAEEGRSELFDECVRLNLIHTKRPGLFADIEMQAVRNQRSLWKRLTGPENAYRGVQREMLSDLEFGVMNALFTEMFHMLWRRYRANPVAEKEITTFLLRVGYITEGQHKRNVERWAARAWEAENEDGEEDQEADEE